MFENTAKTPVSYEVVPNEDGSPSPISIQGSYASIVSAGKARVVAHATASQNYTAAKDVELTVDVSPAPLLVIVNDAERFEGEENPAFTSSLISPASTTGVAVSYSCLADATSPAGEYEIGASVSNSNFVVTVEPGTLTVKAKDPVDPVDPDNPDGPNNPGKPNNPDDPNTPSDPSGPGNPSNPSGPGNPSNPSEPGDADGPSGPKEPSGSNCSGEPGGTGASNGEQNAGSDSLKNQGACSVLGGSPVQEGLDGLSEDGALALSDLSEEAETKAVEQQNVLPTDKKVQFLIAVLLALGCGAAIVVVAAVRRRRS